MADSTVTITFRIPKKLKTKIKETAKREERSITSFVVRALRAAVEENHAKLLERI